MFENRPVDSIEDCFDGAVELDALCFRYLICDFRGPVGCDVRFEGDRVVEKLCEAGSDILATRELIQPWADIVAA